MKEVKEFSRSYIFLSVLYVAIGILLLAGPPLTLRMVGNGFGIIMIVVGVTYGVIYFTGSRRQEGFLQMDLLIAIVCVAFGVFIFFTPEFLSMILPFAVAIVLLVGAIVKIQSSISMKRLLIRRWYLVLIGALLIIALGVFLLVYPFATEAQMIIYIGICLILDGTTNLFDLFRIHFRMKKLAKMQKNNPGVDVMVLAEKERERDDAARAEKKARKKEKNSPEIVLDGKEIQTEESEPQKAVLDAPVISEKEQPDQADDQGQVIDFPVSGEEDRET